jgi:hypothetical protein
MIELLVHLEQSQLYIGQQILDEEKSKHVVIDSWVHVIDDDEHHTRTLLLTVLRRAPSPKLSPWDSSSLQSEARFLCFYQQDSITFMHHEPSFQLVIQLQAFPKCTIHVDHAWTENLTVSTAACNTVLLWPVVDLQKAQRRELGGGPREQVENTWLCTSGIHAGGEVLCRF